MKLEKAVADFTQAGFEIGQAVDGVRNNQGNGWAVAPSTGTTHWATFETAAPVGGAGGTVLTFRLAHFFQDVWTLGRFRISATRSAKPVGLTLPEDFRAILAVASELRSDAQKNALATYFRSIDQELGAKYAALNASKAPLPVDPKLKELRDQLEFAKQPVKPDTRSLRCGRTWR